MNIRPIGKRLVVEPTLETMTRFGLYIPNTPGREKPMQGTVVAVGPDIDPTFIKPGDQVIFGRYAGDDLKYDGKDIKILSADSVLCSIPQA